MNSDRPLCIYHSSCLDGFTSAWIVRKAFPDTEFFPGVYQTPPPNVEGRDVVFVDFCYTKQTMESILDKARTVCILDHHKTAKETIDAIIAERKNNAGFVWNLNSIFDMTSSGATVAWRYYFPNIEIPPVIRYVEDRDLYKLALPKSLEVNAALFSYPYDFEIWDDLMNFDVERLMNEGASILRKHNKDVAELVKAFKQYATIGGHKVPVCNIPYTMTTEAGTMMINQEPTKFAACYWDTPNGRVFSLRSVGDFDVSEIAKIYGGGGHKNASGFTIPHNSNLIQIGNN